MNRPVCGAKIHATIFTLWPSPKPRTVRFHDLRHTTATLLLKACVPLAVVQRILGHSSPTITAGVYGHLDVDDMRAGLEQLSFQPREEPLAKVLSLAVGGPHGAPVVRSGGEGGFSLQRAGGKSRGVERG